MVDDYKCLEPGCPAYANPIEYIGMRGSGFKAKYTVTWFEKRKCWAGHTYLVEIMEEDMKDVDESRLKKQV